MNTMTSETDLRDLAIKLAAMETISTKKYKQSKSPYQKPEQLFTYLVVLDFEATCWDSKPTRKIQNEIIEFAAVLLHIPSRQIMSYFKKYVKPTENPVLSEFCTSLTGIKQSMIQNASTIAEVLNAFDVWLNQKRETQNIIFLEKGEYPSYEGNFCTFATWSDWDLGTCLKKECKRKGIVKESYFNSWIDVRKTYIELYKDHPMGLLGALHSLKMSFVGQEHCGIDDAKNTAYLINQMIEDGVRLVITKSI